MAGPDSGEPPPLPPKDSSKFSLRRVGRALLRPIQASKEIVREGLPEKKSKPTPTDPAELGGRATALPPDLAPTAPMRSLADEAHAAIVVPSHARTEAPPPPTVMRAVTDESLFAVLGVDSWTDLPAIRKGDVGVDVIDTRAAERIAAAAGDPALAARLQQGLDEWHRRLAERQAAGDELLPYMDRDDEPFRTLTLRQTMQEAGINNPDEAVDAIGEDLRKGLNSTHHRKLVEALDTARDEVDWAEIARVGRQLDANSAWYYKLPRYLKVDEAMLDRLPLEQRTLRQLLIDSGVENPEEVIGEIGPSMNTTIRSKLQQARTAARDAEKLAEAERLDDQIDATYAWYDRVPSGRAVTVADLDALPPGAPPDPGRTVPTPDAITASSPKALKSEYIDQLCTVMGVNRADLAGKNPDEVRRIISAQTADAVADGWITADALMAALASLDGSIMSGALSWGDLSAPPPSPDPAHATIAPRGDHTPATSAPIRREAQPADARSGRWRRRVKGYLKEKTPQLVAETLNWRTWPQEEIVYAEAASGEPPPARLGPALNFEDLPLPEPGASLDKYSVPDLLGIMGVNPRDLVGKTGDDRMRALQEQFDTAYRQVEAAFFGDARRDGDPRFAEFLDVMDKAATTLGRRPPKELEHYLIRLSGGTPPTDEPAASTSRATRGPDRRARPATTDESENPFAGQSLDELLAGLQTEDGDPITRADLAKVDPRDIQDNLDVGETQLIEETRRAAEAAGRDPADDIAEARHFFSALRERLAEEGFLPRPSEETAPTAPTTEPDAEPRGFSEEYVTELFQEVGVDRASLVNQEHTEIDRIIGEAITRAEADGVDHETVDRVAHELMRLRAADPVAFFAGLATAPPTETTYEKAPDTRVTTEGDSEGKGANTAELMDTLGLDLEEFRANDPEDNEEALDRALAEIREGFADAEGIRDYFDQTEIELRRQLEEQGLLPDAIQKAPISQLITDLGGLGEENITELTDDALGELLTRRQAEMHAEAEALKADPANADIAADLDDVLGEIDKTHKELERRKALDPKAFYDSIRTLE